MLEAGLASLFGLLIGSFLNVCIYRWPRDLSILRPARSQCPECQHTIAAWDNIPLLSYALLRGRCRHCGVHISWRYPLVEFLTAACFFACVALWGPGLAAVKYALFSALMIGLIFADFDTLLLPDEFTKGGIVAGLAFAWFVPVPDSTFTLIAGMFTSTLNPRLLSLGEAAFGAFLPSVSLWFLGWAFEKLRHKEGLGFGDVKMIAAVGAFLGIRGSLLTVILGSILGSVIGIAYIKLAKKDPSTYQLPFGTFLGIAALMAAFGVRNLIGWL